MKSCLVLTAEGSAAQRAGEGRAGSQKVDRHHLRLQTGTDGEDGEEEEEKKEGLLFRSPRSRRVEENGADVDASASASPQICSQLTDRLERQQVAHAEELEALKVREKLLLLSFLTFFTT